MIHIFLIDVNWFESCWFQQRSGASKLGVQLMQFRNSSNNRGISIILEQNIFSSGYWTRFFFQAPDFLLFFLVSGTSNVIIVYSAPIPRTCWAITSNECMKASLVNFVSYALWFVGKFTVRKKRKDCAIRNCSIRMIAYFYCPFKPFTHLFHLFYIALFRTFSLLWLALSRYVFGEYTEGSTSNHKYTWYIIIKCRTKYVILTRIFTIYIPF